MMKKVWFMLAMMVCILASCSDGGSEEPITPTPNPEEVKTEITIDSGIISNGLSFGATEGEQSISFSVKANWTLNIASTTSGTTWCKASAANGSKGAANVKFAVSENTDYEDRSVSVTIKAGTVSKTFTITQKGADALLVTTTKYEVEQEGGQIEIEVKANISYQMKISEDAKSWITEVESKGRALTTNKHKLDIAMNEDSEKREGEITFKSGDKVEIVKVYQAGGIILLLSQDEYDISDKGDTISVDIKSNIDFGVQMPDVDWIIDEASSRGLSSHTLKYIVSANEGYDSRSADIVFYDKNSDLKDTLNVMQTQKDAILLSQKEFNLSAKADTIKVELSTNVDFEIEIPNVDWINLVASRSLVNREVKFYIHENKSKDKRSAEIIFKNIDKQINDTIIINQSLSDEHIPYLTFVSDGFQSLSMTRAVPTLEYSVNYDKWLELGTDTIEFGGNKGSLRIRGKSSTGTATTYDDCSTFVFFNDDEVACTGDIRTLIDYETYDTVNTSDAKFIKLFWCCTSLTSAPELPAVDLAEYCYGNMFDACASLTSAPDLPANFLAPYCYNSMFGACTSLDVAPELPAMNLAEGCYAHMFAQCTSLTSAPKLIAKTLASYCYLGMFESCTSLTEAPELPIMDLVEGCYANMFYECTSLTSAPDLPATNLAKECYATMFSDCRSLAIVPELFVTELAEGCYRGMFSGCTSLTTAPELPAINLEKNCYLGMFAGCTSLTSAPDLPATNLAEWCYGSMFSGCTSLVSAPELPSTELAEYCYYGMFSNCTSLASAPKLSTMDLVEGCYGSMFSGCTSLISAPELPATNLAEGCYEFMFRKCTSLTTAPVLSATNLPQRCYYYMFDGCSKLNYITMLAINIESNDCLEYWVSGVNSEGTFVKANTMTSLPVGSNGIPVHWTVKNYGEE